MKNIKLNECRSTLYMTPVLMGECRIHSLFQQVSLVYNVHECSNISFNGLWMTTSLVSLHEGIKSLFILKNGIVWKSQMSWWPLKGLWPFWKENTIAVLSKSPCHWSSFVIWSWICRSGLTSIPKNKRPCACRMVFRMVTHRS